MLKAIDCDVEALRDHFPSNVTDPDLLTALAGTDVVFVTADRRITTRPHELMALKSAGITALFLAPFWSKLGRWKQAEWMILRWPKLDGFATGVVKGTFAEVSQGGRCRPFQP